MSQLWDEFVDFAYAKKHECKLLFPSEISKDLFGQMLAFHYHHKNLHLGKNGNEWGFAVFRPVRSADDIEFKWDQPETTLILLDFLYSKCKKTSFQIWKSFYNSNPKHTGIFYYRRGVPKPFTARLVSRFFNHTFRKD